VQEVLQQLLSAVGLVQTVFGAMTQFGPLATLITSFQSRQDNTGTAATQSITLVLTSMCVTPQASVVIKVVPHSNLIMLWNVRADCHGGSFSQKPRQQERFIVLDLVATFGCHLRFEGLSPLTAEVLPYLASRQGDSCRMCLAIAAGSHARNLQWFGRRRDPAALVQPSGQPRDQAGASQNCGETYEESRVSNLIGARYDEALCLSRWWTKALRFSASQDWHPSLGPLVRSVRLDKTCGEHFSSICLSTHILCPARDSLSIDL
jgi:hypothetical protein